MGTTEGHQIFVDVLTRFAEQSRNPRLTPIIARIAVPLCVAVLGRDGVGRGTVGAALTRAGVTVTPDPTAADVHVLVIAEALKPEDRAHLANADRPIVTVLNKADLTGLSDGGPMTRADRRAADCRALTGVPTVPMVALLATADLNDELMSALRVLVTEPADLTSTDATVLAVMAAAVDVVEAAGVEVDRGDDSAAHLRRAVHWRRYSRGPVGALHRSCGADIARGSLRLIGRVR